MPRPIITARADKLFRKQLDAVLDWLEANSGGGGSSAWGGITGTLSSQTDLQSALDAKAAASHTHTASAITNLETTIAARTKAATLSVPSPRYAHRQTITDAGVSPTSKISIGLGAMGPTAENELDLMSAIALSAIPGTGTFEVVARFGGPESGPIPILYTVN